MKTINYSKLITLSITDIRNLLVSELDWNYGKVIYGIHNIDNDKWYIGFSNSMDQRFCKDTMYSHTKKLLDNSGYFILLESVDRFELSILLESDDAEFHEKEFINKYDSYRSGYNGTKDGKSGGDSVSGSIKIYNPNTNHKMHWYLSDGPIPDGYIEGRGYESKGSRGLKHYYNPNTNETTTCEEGKQPLGWIQGQGWNSTLGKSWLYSCKLKLKCMKTLDDPYLKSSDDWRYGAPRGEFWLRSESYDPEIIKLS